MSELRLVVDAVVLDAPVASVLAVVEAALIEAVVVDAALEVESPAFMALVSVVISLLSADSSVVSAASRAAMLEAEALVPVAALVALASVVVAVVLAADDEADWLDNSDDKVLLENCEEALEAAGGEGGGAIEAALSAESDAAPCTSDPVLVAAVDAALVREAR